MSKKQNPAFKYETLDGTFLVVPRKETVGMQESDLKRYIEELHKAFDTSHAKNVVVDIGSAPFFSSIIIGAILGLCHRTRETEGTAALCNASAGMYEVINVMKLDSVMPYFKTREEAVASFS
ncbi:hypothetical protein MNBD_PLANCTO02-1333 [hydrothermal vent metagenome]|uniref:STAS domain-containing protein n=1 Tax=hydrothermal vent metagenome TaxID=652676 RepID=A0A3B1E1B8_9ZZZZ